MEYRENLKIWINLGDMKRGGLGNVMWMRGRGRARVRQSDLAPPISFPGERERESRCTGSRGLAALLHSLICMQNNGRARECICIWKSLVWIYSISWGTKLKFRCRIYVRFFSMLFAPPPSSPAPLFHIAQLFEYHPLYEFSNSKRGIFECADIGWDPSPLLLYLSPANKIDRKISEFEKHEWLSEVIWLLLLLYPPSPPVCEYICI